MPASTSLNPSDQETPNSSPPSFRRANAVVAGLGYQLGRAHQLRNGCRDDGAEFRREQKSEQAGNHQDAEDRRAIELDSLRQFAQVIE